MSLQRIHFLLSYFKTLLVRAKFELMTSCTVVRRSINLTNRSVVYCVCNDQLKGVNLTVDCYTICGLSTSQGIAFKDYMDFFCFMRNISEADMALSFHNAAGKAIDPGMIILSNIICTCSVECRCRCRYVQNPLLI